MAWTIERLRQLLGFTSTKQRLRFQVNVHCPDCGYEVHDYAEHKPLCTERVEVRPGVSLRESWGFDAVPPVAPRKGPPPTRES
jgi:hypothetical protein